jgi:hypothetical protein
MRKSHWTHFIVPPRHLVGGGYNAPHNPDFVSRPRFGNDGSRTSPRNQQHPVSILLAGEKFSWLEQLQLR